MIEKEYHDVTSPLLAAESTPDDEDEDEDEDEDDSDILDDEDEE